MAKTVQDIHIIQFITQTQDNAQIKQTRADRTSYFHARKAELLLLNSLFLSFIVKDVDVLGQRHCGHRHNVQTTWQDIMATKENQDLIQRVRYGGFLELPQWIQKKKSCLTLISAQMMHCLCKKSSGI